MSSLTLLYKAALILVLATEAHAKSATEVFESVSGSIVVVYGNDAQGKHRSLGSGVVLPGGAVVTNCHVIEKSENFVVKYRQQEYPATLKHTDHDRDVCSLTVSGLKAQIANLGTTKALKVGQRVYAIGAPKGLELTLSEGIVSSLREVEGGRYIQTSAPISPGSSGGGLFDEESRLIGLPTFYLTEGQQLNFAVPIEWVKELPRRHTVDIKSEQSKTEWLTRAIVLEVNQEWQSLIKHALHRTMSLPDDVAAWYVLGSAYAKTGQNDKAIDATQRALRINPEHAAAWHNLAVCYEKTAKDDKAIDAYRHSLRIDLQDAEGWHDLGNVYGRTGEMPKAIEAFQQTLRIDPLHADAWIKLGVAYTQSGQLAKAIETHQSALKANPKIAGKFDYWVNYAAAQDKAGQFENAIGTYTLALGLNPKDADTWRQVGMLYFQTEQFVKAFEALQRSVQINPNNAKSWAGIGLLWMQAEKYDEAIKAYQEAIRIDPDFAEAWFSLGKPYASLKRYDDAIAANRQAIRIDPVYASAWHNLAIYYYLSGDTPAALQAAKALRPLDPAKAEKLFNLIMPN
jgi:tetratricopeptide (TPR) repeat protein